MDLIYKKIYKNKTISNKDIVCLSLKSLKNLAKKYIIKKNIFELKKKNVDEILNKITQLEDNIINELNKCFDNLEDMKIWINNISEKYFVQYFCDISPNKNKNLYTEAARLMSNKLKELLTKKYLLREYVNIIVDTYKDINNYTYKEKMEKFDSYINELETISNKFTKDYKPQVIHEDYIAEEMEYSNFNGIKNIFRILEDKLNIPSEMRTMIFGKLGAGKSTLISRLSFSKTNWLFALCVFGPNIFDI